MQLTQRLNKMLVENFTMVISFLKFYINDIYQVDTKSFETEKLRRVFIKLE